jgi:hypothetical protein
MNHQPYFVVEPSSTHLLKPLWIPTQFLPSFTDAQTAFSTGLAYVTSDNIVVMKGDNTTLLAPGEVRPR